MPTRSASHPTYAAMLEVGRAQKTIFSNRRDEQEMFVLCLRILQSALVYVNTLMLQDILGETEWATLLTPVTVSSPRTAGDEEPAEEGADA
ncbi:TnpA family transposase [Streptomyces sp. V3I8]|uniref:Tn3 family transposase n=1 Tax=Streptomyces sp. V3I8 TaxID=3042279 RepID=UPI0027866561|nr:Tn3 family transposase [Streptomyces sp. V3I8]MDQ1035616.1 TnpA family transposase [Streptomyces sp. V3I8]